MKKLLICLSFSALVLVITTPALAQAPQEDQYGGPEVISCDEYLSYEVPPRDIVEKCSAQYNHPRTHPTGPPVDEARGIIPEANKSSNQTLDGFSNTLSEIRSGGQNKAEAEEIAADKPSSRPDTGEPGVSGVVAADADESAPLPEPGGMNEAGAVRSASKDTDAAQEAGAEQADSGSKSNNGNNSVDNKKGAKSKNNENSADSKNKASVRNEEEDAGDGSREAATEASNVAALSDVTELPQTAGVPFILVSASVLLLAGGLAASRLFR